MEKKHPEIFKNKLHNLKTKVQNDFYVHADDIKETKKISKEDLIAKINNIFKRPDYVYQADITIMYKNNENKIKKIIGFKDNYIITIDNEKISIDDIYDIK